MGIGITLQGPAGVDNYVDAVVGRARKAAAAGVRSAWFGQRFDYDAAALAAIVGREVPTLQVGTSAIPIFGRHPLLVGAQAQTAQAATAGRFHLGLGLGAGPFVESTLGISFDRPIARLREFLTALRPYLETGHTDHHGDLITATTPMPSALPGASPAVPILVAAMGPQALRVTGELADGTLPLLAGPRVIAEHIVPPLAKAVTEAGRSAPRVVAFVHAVVTDDVDSTRERAAAQIGFLDQFPSYQRVLALGGVTRGVELAAIGDEKLVTATIRDHFDAGATEVIVGSAFGTDADQERTWRLLGELNREWA
ncbi:TIGR03564 family F420-dependent LLM class oxidoreductase [Kutzneria sp. CA-103260]|uniref:TIGR03564 family F420-dependent LLM class oxidoreductase n=1 Tax=Kutzneria sp. CA-103260 TaxID=2802641 RepID=UPI001BA73155|nr:TIGR03564 family F420-dependent LLM class oxidoreductase [Kutzneria sp. CA-103260]QUQ66823.1 LLM class F420-dependent oxidoreductase [Kutzneria sp. CA-103260]